ncbi:coiled-coil domain-containing protein 148-like [Osmerus eperlanus]|uniref:coiled-coil domain-containing protein 148-like n=1 Tax=Osmerus eperlanus TaxID=29151 RepID=UPI002E1083C7
MKNGLWCSRYKPAEYHKLQALVEAKRQETAQIGQKVVRTLQAARASRESSVGRQHRQVWNRESARLAWAGARAETELQACLGDSSSTHTPDRSFLSELLHYELVLQRERELFQAATVAPVWQLKEDLQVRLPGTQRPPLTPAHTSDWEQVLIQVNLVKQQQDSIMEKLSSECRAVEDQVASLHLQVPAGSLPGSLAELGLVPEEVLGADDLFPELRDSLVHAFLALGDRYRCRLQAVQDRLQGLDRFGGWSAEEHLLFQVTVEQYPADLPRRRALYTDMLHRVLPHRSTHQLNEHERSWDWQRFTQAQLLALAQGWHRDRAELLAKALVTMEEARQERQEHLNLQRDRQNQLDICSRLRDKLQQWHAQQEEVARLEADVTSRRQEEEEERLRRSQERDSALRTRQKHKVRQFYTAQQRQREAQEWRDQQRLEELRRAMAEQARRDKERVQFRASVLQQRREEGEVRALERLKEEEHRENRLEALRNQVAVVAEGDPARMMGDTAAWRNRQQGGEQEKFVLHKPLYDLHTYTDTQIVSDPRVRIEQALRQAGLHNTPYAQQVFSGLKPLRPPRRDTESTGFRS